MALITAGFQNVNSLLGGTAGATDSLTGINATASWTIGSANGGSYSSTNTLSFSNVENLTGGSDSRS